MCGSGVHVYDEPDNRRDYEGGYPTYNETPELKRQASYRLQAEDLTDWPEIMRRASAPGMLGVEVGQDDGPFAIVIPLDKFRYLIEQMEELEDAIAALKAEADEEPRLTLKHT